MQVAERKTEGVNAMLERTEGRPGCVLGALKNRFRAHGLRPTHQRVALGWLLFGRGDRHVTADMLYDEARGARMPVSLATVYNTLNAFAEKGLIRQMASVGQTAWFDTNTTDHHHFLDEAEGRLFDLDGQPSVTGLPPAPEGYEVVGCDVVVRLRRITG